MMKMMRWWRIAAGVSTSALLAGSAMAQGEDARPNILVILADDLGYSDLGAYGGEIETPNLDALAGDGLLFTQFYANASCSPTRSMLMSGTDNHIAGVGMMAELRAAAPSFVNVPGSYDGSIRENVAIMPEVLNAAGYNTVMAGKWHLGYTPDRLPHNRGFDHSFALLQGGAAHFKQENMAGLQGWRTDWLENGEPTELPDDFYSSTFLTDYLIEHIGEGEGEPFFAWAAYTAPHWPVQAPADDIAHYEGRYDAGYEAIMQARLDRQKELGLNRIDSPAEPIFEQAPAWAEMSDEERAISARKMEVYAAAVTALDREIGRLVDHLKDTDQFDNTVIFFMSDNGAELQMYSDPDWVAQNFDNSLENLGHPNSFSEMSAAWAQVSMTPNRLWKMTSFEGGIRVPTFIHYPAMVDSGMTDALATVMDIYPTVLDLTGVGHPGLNFQGRQVVPMSGMSMVPFLSGEDGQVHSDSYALGLEVANNGSLRKGDWKLVYAGDLSNREWQLFNLASPEGERMDVAEENPEILADMMREWRAFVTRNGVAVNGELHPVRPF